MKRRASIFCIVIAVISLIGILFGSFFMKSYFNGKVYQERKDQLEELTTQLSSTFSNALKFNWACTNSAANMIEKLSFATKDDLDDEVKWLDDNLETDSNDAFFLLIDTDGRCYDSTGSKGVWGDFDSIADESEKHTFIADSATYEGVYWAFAQKLSDQITTEDGKTVITHIVLMKTVASLKNHYTSDAYKDVCETYILNSNGTRMYDSVTASDTISAYNIYKYLRSCESPNGESFDELLDILEDDGVACGDFTIEDEEYYISVASLEDYNTVLLFLLPEEAVAENTLSMVSGISSMFMAVGVIVIVLISIMILSMARLQNTRALAKQKERNLGQLEQINRRLEEANASLEKARLASEDALVIAKAANSAKSSFLSNMSHDIRTPLNAIVGFTTLIKRDADNPEKVLETASKIDSASELLLSIINDVLDMSRIESGKTTLHTESFKLDEMLSEIENVISEQANQRSQTFKVIKKYPINVTVLGDKLRLNQILMNLLSNALKYTPKNGEIKLEVKMYNNQVPGAAADVSFVVSDNGIGMSAEFLEHVFEPFTRAHESVTNTIQGTGLGLAITKSLVELLGGVITVKSELKRGSVFKVDIPLTIQGSEKESAEEQAKTEVPADILKGKHFLVAEDNGVNAEILSELLKMEGATCAVAQNGQIAVEMFERAAVGEYAAILMDIQMPIMDGYEATRRIRASSHAEAAAIPIAAMTANAFTEDVSQAFASGMNAHISKPVNMGKIKEFMASVLSSDGNSPQGGGV